jgi:hypothetical protein
MDRHCNRGGLASLVGGLLLAATAHAAPILVHVDTSGATGDATMFFDFTNGDAIAGNNDVTILSFTTDGTLQNDAATLGDATGSLASLPITLADALADFSSYSQSLTLGTFIEFSYDISANGSMQTPDAFAFSLLDQAFNSVIPTSSPTGALLLHSIGNPDQPEIFADAVTLPAASVPEPGSAALALLAILAIAYARYRSRCVQHAGDCGYTSRRDRGACNTRTIAATLRGGAGRSEPRSMRC